MSRASDRFASTGSDLGRLMREAANRRNIYDVFGDFCEMAAISLANAVDYRQREPREARYMQIIKRYEPHKQQLFPQMLAALVMRMEAGPDDVLGRLFSELEIHNTARGQFFTPYELCKLMADLQIGDGGLDRAIAENGFVTVNEPACGAGAMMIAFADAMRGKGYNPQTQMHATCQDIDSRGVHMCYLHLSLLHIPAVVVLGNTLTVESREVWYTPAHILGGWSRKLRMGRHPLIRPANDNKPEPVVVTEPEPQPIPEPIPEEPEEPRKPLGDQFSLF